MNTQQPKMNPTVTIDTRVLIALLKMADRSLKYDDQQLWLENLTQQVLQIAYTQPEGEQAIVETDVKVDETTTNPKASTVSDQLDQALADENQNANDKE